MRVERAENALAPRARDGGKISRESLEEAVAEPGEGLIPAAVYSVQPAGSETTIHLKMGQTDVLAKEMGIRNYQVDRQVGLRIDPDKINVFDKTTGRLIKLAVPD